MFSRVGKQGDSLLEQGADVESRTLVIVGNGMVGHALCAKLVEQSAHEKLKIVVFGDEHRVAYDRVHLSQFFDGKTAQSLELKPPNWYADHGIELRIGQRVTRIDRKRKRVFSGQDESICYDRLVLATGSRPFVPPVEGVDSDGVFVYRTIEDLEAIKAWSGRVDSAAVLGGGLLGLEAAKALVNLNLETHIVEMAPALMPRQLDSSGAAVLQKKIEAMGIGVHTLKRTGEIATEGARLKLRFGSDDELSVGMVVISAGIRPCDELAEQSGLALGRRGGIKVDDELRTSDENIFAIGECASHNDVIYGLVGPGYQMADVLAGNIGGQRERFTGADQSAKLKLLGVDVTSLGVPIGEVPFASTASVTSGEGPDQTYRKLILYKRQLVGAVAVGPWAEIGRVQQSIAAGRRIWPWNLTRFEMTGKIWKTPETQSVASWPDNATVCSCLKISRGTLSRAKAEGCSTVEALACQTGASTVCGSCRPLLADLVDSQVEPPAKLKPGLSIVALVAAALLSLWLLVGGLPFASSVTHVMHQVDFIWRDSFWKQVTGYTLVGIATIGLALPLRKRVKRFSFGSYGFWRTAHAVVGTLTVVGLIVHTGMHMGANLNLLLSVVFLAINVTGVAVALVTTMESKASGEWMMQVRRWRPRISNLHLWLFWPLPALLAIHIFCVYFY